jgi:para-aminobenzoate synthetase component 1
MENSDSLFYLRFPRKDCEALLAEGIQDSYEVAAGDIIDWIELKEWMAKRGEWIFGWIGYDARRSLEHFEKEDLESSGFPQLYLFIPKNVFKISGEKVEVIKGEWKPEFEHWLSMQHPELSDRIQLIPRISFEEYQTNFNELQHQIAVGNIYEINYCVPFQSKAHLFDLPVIWKRLYQQTEAPFSAFAQCSSHHVLCASPERYLCREGNRVFSQPIKGTIRRGGSQEEDEQLREQLRLSKKERSENVMIVDLVRNDLSRCATRSTVQVDELFGVHTFKTVHHLISTVSCEVDSSVSWVDLIQASFPMGSMTGAPKVSAMQLIAEQELTERGVYSGSIGYIEPSGDFDFNVVIRSVQYDDSTGLISCHVGGALTAQSNAEDEYQECLLKAKAVLSALLGA